MILKLGDSAPNFEDWKKGDSVIVDPTVTNDELVKKYPGGYDEIKPYLRYIPDPERDNYLHFCTLPTGCVERIFGL